MEIILSYQTLHTNWYARQSPHFLKINLLYMDILLFCLCSKRQFRMLILHSWASHTVPSAQHRQEEILSAEVGVNPKHPWVWPKIKQQKTATHCGKGVNLNFQTVFKGREERENRRWERKSCRKVNVGLFKGVRESKSDQKSPFGSSKNLSLLPFPPLILFPSPQN